MFNANSTQILKFQIEAIPRPKCKFEAEQKNQMKVFLTSAIASAFGPNHVVYILDFVHLYNEYYGKNWESLVSYFNIAWSFAE